MKVLIYLFLIAFGLGPVVSQFIKGGQFGGWWAFPILAIIIWALLYFKGDLNK